MDNDTQYMNISQLDEAFTLAQTIKTILMKNKSQEFFEQEKLDQ